jgi:hypothetical protein
MWTVQQITLCFMLIESLAHCHEQRREERTPVRFGQENVPEGLEYCGDGLLIQDVGYGLVCFPDLLLHHGFCYSTSFVCHVVLKTMKTVAKVESYKKEQVTFQVR